MPGFWTPSQVAVRTHIALDGTDMSTTKRQHLGKNSQTESKEGNIFGLCVFPSYVLLVYFLCTSYIPCSNIVFSNWSLGAMGHTFLELMTSGEGKKVQTSRARLECHWIGLGEANPGNLYIWWRKTMVSCRFSLQHLKPIQWECRQNSDDFYWRIQHNRGS